MSLREVLRLDINGQPQQFITKTEAALYYATESVVWTIGDVFASLRGGMNSESGVMSQIDLHPIIAVSGAAKMNLFDLVPPLTNRSLFARDRHICCYCAKQGKDDNMTREHIIPTSKGGLDKWDNVVCACKFCNGKKGNKSLDESGMRLLYFPYVPSHAEGFLLSGRQIRADVLDFLMAKLPKGSRLL